MADAAAAAAARKLDILQMLPGSHAIQPVKQMALIEANGHIDPSSQDETPSRSGNGSVAVGAAHKQQDGVHAVRHFC